MNKYAFDAERAAKGEPVQWRAGPAGQWVDVIYIGRSKDRERYYLEDGDGDLIPCYDPAQLRMKPMPIKKWVLEFETLDAAKWAVDNLSQYRTGVKVTHPIPPIKEVEIPAEGA